MFREIPFGIIQYPLFEYLKQNLENKSDLNLCLCGAQAGGIAGIITTPIDVLKTKIMTQLKFKFNIQTTINLLKTILREEGVKGLFKGVTMRITYISIGGMIFFGVNEKVKTVLNFYDDNQIKL